MSKELGLNYDWEKAIRNLEDMTVNELEKLQQKQEGLITEIIKVRETKKIKSLLASLRLINPLDDFNISQIDPRDTIPIEHTSLHFYHWLVEQANGENFKPYAFLYEYDHNFTFILFSNYASLLNAGVEKFDILMIHPKAFKLYTDLYVKECFLSHE